MDSLLRFKQIKYRQRKICAVCDKNLGKPLLDLPKFPITEIYIDHKPNKRLGFIDQVFYFCENCGHGQIGNIVSTDVLYNKSNYSFRTSKSQSAKKVNDVFLNFIKSIIKRKRFDSVIEIGCSDLYLLRKLVSFGKELIGIDPVLDGEQKSFFNNKIKIFGDFFENFDLKTKSRGQTLVISSHTLEHVEEPKTIIEKLLLDSNDESIFIFQFPGLETLVKDGRYDQIFHQHLQYFSVRSFSFLVERFGGEVIDYKVNYNLWGSLMIAFRKRKGRINKNIAKDRLSAQQIKIGYDRFGLHMKNLGMYLKSLKGERVVGYPATLMLPVLSYHLDNDLSDLSCILDRDPKKDGLYYINLPVVIKSLEKIKDFSDINILMTAVSTGRALLPALEKLSPKRIIFPLNTV